MLNDIRFLFELSKKMYLNEKYFYIFFRTFDMMMMDILSVFTRDIADTTESYKYTKVLTNNTIGAGSTCTMEEGVSWLE